MHGSGGASNPLVLDLGARMTAGYYEGQRPICLTFATPYPDTEPEVLRNLHLVKTLGCAALDPTLEFPLFLEERMEARIKGFVEEKLERALERKSKPK